MTFMITLGHFCEQHGPVSIISTEPIVEKDTSDDKGEDGEEENERNGSTISSANKDTEAKENFRNNTLRTFELLKSTTCMSCRLILPRKRSQLSSSNKSQILSPASDIDDGTDSSTRERDEETTAKTPPTPVFSLRTREYGITIPHFKDRSCSITYMSSQYPNSQSRHYAVKQACMSIFSVEHCPPDTVLSASILKRGSDSSSSCDSFPTSFFQTCASAATISGNSHTGFCLSVRFQIPDSTARGLCRAYALMCISECEMQLARVASLVEATFDRTIASIVAAAERAASAAAADCHKSMRRQETGSENTSDNEEEGGQGQNNSPNRSRNDGWTEYGPDRYLRRREGKIQSRSLVDLVGDDQLFVKLHSVFSNLLSVLVSINPPKR